MTTATLDSKAKTVTTGNTILAFPAQTPVASIMALLANTGYVCVSSNGSVLRYAKYGNSVGNGHQMGA